MPKTIPASAKSVAALKRGFVETSASDPSTASAMAAMQSALAAHHAVSKSQINALGAAVATATTSATGTVSTAVISPASTGLVPPRILAITPDNGFSLTDGITNVGRITVRGAAIAGIRVHVFIDGVEFGAVTVPASGSWQYTVPTALAAGAHTITVTGRDAAGTIVAGGNAYNVLIDVTGPTNVALLSIGTDTGTPGDFVTQAARLSLSGTAEAGTRLTILIDGVAVAQQTVGSTGLWQYNLRSDLSEASHQITLRVQDIAGNIVNRTYQAVIDSHTAVTISGVEASVGGTAQSVDTGAAINGTAVTLNGSYDAGATLTISIRAPNGVSATVPAASIIKSGANWDTAFDLAALFGPGAANGAYVITVSVADLAGNQASQNYTLNYDSAIAPLAVENVLDQTGSITGNVVDGGGTDAAALRLEGTAEAGAIITVTVTAPGGTQAALPASAIQTNGTSWTGNVSLTDLFGPAPADGTYTITTSSRDAAGNVSNSVTRTVVIDRTVPTVGITDVTDDAGTVRGVIAAGGVTDDETLAVRGTLEAGSVLTITVSNGTLTATLPTSAITVNGTQWTANVNVTSLGFNADGTYTIRAVTTDAVGNVSTAATHIIILDNAPPGVQVAEVTDDAGSVTGQIPDSGATDDETLAIRGTLEAGAVLQATLRYGSSTINIPASAITVNGTAWSINLDVLASGFGGDGTYTLGLTVRDAAGNAQTVNRSFVLDNAPPSATYSVLYDPTPTDTSTTDRTPYLSGTTEAGSAVELLFNNVVLDRVVAQSNGSWVIDRSLSSSLALGDYEIRVTDPTGHQSTRTLSIVAGSGFIDRSFSNDTGVSHAVAWGDYNGDGRIDYYASHNDGTVGLLYANGPAGFVQQPSITLPNDSGFARGALWVDFDGDGDLDLFSHRAGNVSAQSGGFDRLYRNNDGGNFTDAGSLFVNAPQGRSTGSAWADYDRDGDLDLVVSNYLGQTMLWSQASDGSFTSRALGNALPYRAVSFIDFDRDGDQDILLLRDGGIDLYRNEGGVIDNVADDVSGLTGDLPGTHTGWAWGDYNNDGRFDLFVTYYSSASSVLFTQQANGTFVRTALVNNPTSSTDTTSALWFDYDQDGDLDLYVTNGSGQQNILWRNNGTGFTANNIPLDLGDSANAAWVDFDYDGDLDLSVANYNGNRLFENANTPAGGSFLAIRLTASDGGFDVNGAIVTLRDSGGALVAIRINDGNQPVYFYNLNNQNYQVTIEYNGMTIVHNNVNPSESQAIHLPVSPGYIDDVLGLTATGYDEIFRPESDGTVLRIANFETGAGGDRLDIGDLLSSYTGGNNLTTLQNDGFVNFVQNGTNLTVQIDSSGGGDQYQTVAILLNTNLPNVTIENFVL